MHLNRVFSFLKISLYFINIFVLYKYKNCNEYLHQKNISICLLSQFLGAGLLLEPSVPIMRLWERFMGGILFSCVQPGLTKHTLGPFSKYGSLLLVHFQPPETPWKLRSGLFILHPGFLLTASKHHSQVGVTLLPLP